jgi:ABC-type branched-subunit amino acid transport system ATPase component/ABC-type branched-subunit amino acid transport system permease subunit
MSIAEELATSPTSSGITSLARKFDHRMRTRAALVVKIAFCGLLIAVPWFAGFNTDQYTIGLALIILLLSLGLLVRTAGQSSLCQVAFAAVGACAFSDFAVRFHIPWLVALLLAGLAAVPVGALVAIPAVRLSRLMLAVATFGFGIVISEWIYPVSIMFGTSPEGIQTPRPSLSWLSVGSDRGFYYVVLAITALIALGVTLLVRGRLGRLLAGLSDSPIALAAHGVSSNILVVTTFCISAFMASIAGALTAMAIGSTTTTSYNPYNSLTYFALVVIVVGVTPWYGVIAAVGPTLVAVYVTNASAPNYLELLFGASAILTAVILRRNRQRGQISIFSEFRGVVPHDRAGPHATEVAIPAEPVNVHVGRSLSVVAVSVHFGGVIALSDVSLEAKAGAITGLIGPNGAGKTTLFNVCSGLIDPAAGKIVLDGSVDLSKMSVPKRAGLGVGRTFQAPRLFESLTVSQNVALGAEAHLAGRRPQGQLWGSRDDGAKVLAAVDRAIQSCALEEIASAPVVTLSAGRRRVVELARCLATGFGVLLLDEPSAGLDRDETQVFGEILTSVVRETGVGILLVEHDMDLVMRICEHIYVLDAGSVLYEGTPVDVARSDVVRRAYLGEMEEGDDANAV